MGEASHPGPQGPQTGNRWRLRNRGRAGRGEARSARFSSREEAARPHFFGEHERVMHSRETVKKCPSVTAKDVAQVINSVSNSKPYKRSLTCFPKHVEELSLSKRFHRTSPFISAFATHRNSEMVVLCNCGCSRSRLTLDVTRIFTFCGRVDYSFGCSFTRRKQCGGKKIRVRRDLCRVIDSSVHFLNRSDLQLNHSEAGLASVGTPRGALNLHLPLVSFTLVHHLLESEGGLVHLGDGPRLDNALKHDKSMCFPQVMEERERVVVVRLIPQDCVQRAMEEIVTQGVP